MLPSIGVSVVIRSTVMTDEPKASAASAAGGRATPAASPQACWVGPYGRRRSPLLWFLMAGTRRMGAASSPGDRPPSRTTGRHSRRLRRKLYGGRQGETARGLSVLCLLWSATGRMRFEAERFKLNG